MNAEELEEISRLNKEIDELRKVIIKLRERNQDLYDELKVQRYDDD